MRKGQFFIPVFAALLLVFASLAVQASGAQPGPNLRVRKMVITGEIAQGDNSYIIRGKVPAEIFTILNPDPKILDELVKSAKTVKLEVRIVSGDNVEIRIIDGQEYRQ